MRLIALTICLILCFVAIGAKERQTLGTATYAGTRDTPPAECRARALELARIEALRQAWGTIVAQEVLQTDVASTGKEHSHFMAITSADVRGEWLADLSEPVYTTQTDEDGSLTVTCTIKVLSRPLGNEAVNFEAETLRGAPQRRFATADFREEDDFFLWMCPAADGYVQVYLMDEAGQVAMILPYDGSQVQDVALKAGEEYIFFSPEVSGKAFGRPRTYRLYTDRLVEFNKLFVIFSPRPFAPPVTRKSARNVPPMLDVEAFTRWRLKAQRADPKMAVRQFNLRITKVQL